MAGGNVIDKKNSELLAAGVFDSKENDAGKLSKNTENAINAQVEASFSSFLNDSTVKSKTQKTFNEWLDIDVGRVLNLSANREVGENTEAAETKLLALKFEIELSGFQQKVINGAVSQPNEAVEVTDREELKTEDLNIWKMFNRVEPNNIVTEINKIKYNDKFKEMSDLLKSGKEADIKQFQLNILNVLKKKDGGDNRLEKTWNDVKNRLKGDPLGGGGVDGKFGEKTMSALEDYVAAVNDLEVDGTATGANGAANATTGGASGGGGNNAANSSLNGGRVTNNSEIAQNTINYKMKNKYEVKKGEMETLALNVTSDKRSVYPPNKNIKLDKKNNKLIYTGETVGNHNFTLKIRDANGNMKEKIMTVDVSASKEDVKKQHERKKAYDQHKDLKLSPDFNKSRIQLNEVMKDLKRDYQALDDEIKKLDQDQNKNKNIDNKDLIVSKKKEQKEIKSLTEKLLTREVKMSLIYMMNNDLGLLGNKLNDNCVYYFDGEYLSQKKFLKKMEKTEINTNTINYLNLDVDWKGGEMTTDKYLKSDVGDLTRNWQIKKLILTDDASIAQNGFSRNVETQYKSESYGKMENTKSDIGERRALKRILGIKGLFGMGGSDEEQSGYDQNYDVSFETEGLFSKERRKLKKLKNVLLDLNKDKDIDISDAFEMASSIRSMADLEKRKDDKVDKNIRKLGEIYLLSRSKTAAMPQLAKSLGLLENYFVRGVDDITKFAGIYKKENIGTMDGLINPDKKRKAIRKLFKGEYFEGADNFPAAVKGKKLNQLKRIIKKIDLTDFFEGNNRSKGKYGKFNTLYTLYSNNKLAGLKDKNDNIVVRGGVSKNVDGIVECNEEELYYNAVFDFLVGVGEGNQNIVESVNSMKVSQNVENIQVDEDEVWYGDRFVDENGDWSEKELSTNYTPYNAKEEKQFLLQLADYNSDARSDFADGGLRMGMQIKNTYKDVKLDQMAGISSNDSPAWQNIIEFAQDWLQKTGKTALLADLNKLGDGDVTAITLEEINTEIARNPGLLNVLQEMLANSPIPVEYIYKYGNDAAESYLNNPATELLPNMLDGKIEVDGAEMLLNKEIKKLAVQGLKTEEIPELKSVLRPMFYGALIKAGGIVTGAAGIGLALDTKRAGTFSLNLGYTEMSGTGVGPLDGTLGVMMSWGDDWKMGQNTTGNAGVGMGTIGFVPVVAGNVGIKALMNPNKMSQETLKPISAKYFKVNAHLAIVGGILTYGAGLGISSDKMKGINTKYKIIENQLSSRTGIISHVLESVAWGGGRDIAISQIKNEIAQKFYKGKFDKVKNRDDKIMISQAAENMYRGLSYYNLDAQVKNGKISDSIKANVIHDMAENYALQWRNQAVKSSIDDMYVDGFGVGVSFLAGFMPIPYAHVSVSDYKNLYYTETQKSVADYYAQLSTGMGMERIEDDKFYNKNGITKYAVSYLNAKMSIAHPGIETPDLDIKLNYDISDDAPVWDHPDNKVPQALCIPLDMYKYANINISSDMESYVNITEYKNGDGDNVKYLVVPINSKISLLSRSGGNAGKFNLIIGDTKAELDDIQLDGNMGVGDLTGNTAEFNDGMNAQYMDVDKVNTQIDRLRDLSLSVGGNSPIVVENPLDSCENDVNGNLVFNLIDGVASKCEDMGGVNSELEIDKSNNKMTMPQFGTLTIHYVQPNTGAGKYEMYYSSSPSDGLKINFDAETEDFIDQPVETIGGIQRNEVVNTNFGNVDVFDDYGLDSIFENIEDDLSTMDDKNASEYATFMNVIAEAGVGDLIDNTDYDSSFDALKNIIKNKLSNTMFDNLRKKVNLPVLDSKEKVLIVDRFKAIFSYHIDLTNNKANVSYLKSLVERRKDVYKGLYGYDKATKYPLTHDYREDIINSFGKNDNLERKEVNGLFGFTAFYRLGKESQGRGYSMTQMGSTNVLGNKMMKIPNNELESTQNWFINNLNKSEVHKQLLKDNLLNHINKNGTIINSLTDDDLGKILSGKELDIDGEKYKIKLDLDYYFYLLGECANESIGIKLGGLTVRKSKTITPNPNFGGDEDRTATKLVGASSSGGMYVNSVDGLNFANASKKSAVIGVAAIGDKGPGNPGDGTGEVPDPGDGTGEIPDPNDGTGEGDGTGG